MPERTELERATSGLSLADRWRVRQTVEKGRAVSNPALAEAAVARARYVRAYGAKFLGRGWRSFIWAIAAVQLPIAALRLWTSDQGLGSYLWAAYPLFLAAFIASLPAMQRRSVERAAQAEELNPRVIAEAPERIAAA